MATWTRPFGYSKSEINKAGNILVGAIWANERDEALKVIDNFRASHGYPLHIATKTLKKRAKVVDRDVFVAQRLKRLSSITSKLERFPDMNLARMQDIGGCRAVLHDVEQVKRLVQQICDADADYKKTDYINKPKLDGYRSIHIVGRYQGVKENTNVWNGLQIELQIRSRLQHAWATAVETVSAFTGQQLKSNIGVDDWKRFFALMGSAIARIEKCPLVPNTPDTAKELLDEIRELSNKLLVIDTLRGFRVAVQTTDEVPNAKTFLLELDTKEQVVRITPYSATQSKLASKEYLKIEQEFANDDLVQVVLVSVDSLKTLRNAYPNYYLDTTEFLDILEGVMRLDL